MHLYLSVPKVTPLVQGMERNSKSTALLQAMQDQYQNSFINQPKIPEKHMVYKIDRLLNIKCTKSVALPELHCNLCSGITFYHPLPGLAFICRWVAILWPLMHLVLDYPHHMNWNECILAMSSQNLIIFKNWLMV